MDYQIKNEILAAIGNVSQKVDIMQKDIYEMKKQVAKIPEIEKQVAKIPEIEKQVAKIPEMQREIAKIAQMQKEIAELQKETRSISRSVAVIEHEHGDKLKALFDIFTAHTEKMEKQDNRINFCEHKLDNHTAEIDYLKTKVQGL
ncbi:MAG: hypothetical protein HFJ34_06300 [Clostridia bacterium]|nr:hypothetical protein [Clostridia bacterium]